MPLKKQKVDTLVLPQAAATDRPGKASAAMVRTANLEKLERQRPLHLTGPSAWDTQREAERCSGRPRFGYDGNVLTAEQCRWKPTQARWVGDLKEGLYPGDSSIFRLKDGTMALKTNTDGIISKKPVDGEPFTEEDGTRSVYECGVLVHSSTW
jgi:hypothetical protein